ncbi:transcriptional regulator [Marinobacterium nitratireducens]|uniref:Transcriptional regulator n=1 Tax=Marinobacterium nitratireducens TaxID=518897 RepID=A0A917ZP47_9GAMM|nr:LysR family transcriptional regulator [Marinobacterium nitratireducens]GGO87636.1 transcriptional regulator [Marinobacterium nitratireducens]
MRLSRVDLNLFIVFDTIYNVRNLTRTAEILSITQPAVSNALSRLRKTFDDQLFVRTPKAMVPTPVADNIAVQVREALQLLNLSIQEGNHFSPGTSDKVFRLSMNDLPEALLLPALEEKLQASAPGLGIQSHYHSRKEFPDALASGTLDLAIDVPLLNDPQLCHQPLFTDEYVCMVRNDHPLVGEELTLETYLALGHILVSSRPSGVGQVDAAVNNLGLARKIKLRVKHYMVAPLVALRTDLALTVPSRLARQYDARILKLPFDMPPLEWHLYWHKSADLDQANRWFREQLLK